MTGLHLFSVLAILAATSGGVPKDQDIENQTKITNEVEKIEASLKSWRFTMPYFNSKKNTFVCRTAVKSGDKKADKLACASMIVCYNKYKEEHIKMLGNSIAKDPERTAARDFYTKRNLCLREEIKPRIVALAKQRVSKLKKK